jgi:metal-sulfur cluster biosynthetic enzyme
MMDSSLLDDQVRAALDQVCDPCSIAANAPLSIIDMGLVRGWELDNEGNLVVSMCVTSPSCTMGAHMVRAAEAELAKITGVKNARVEIDAAVFWTPASMTEVGRADLERRRQASVEKSPVMPQQWRQRRQEVN